MGVVNACQFWAAFAAQLQLKTEMNAAAEAAEQQKIEEQQWLAGNEVSRSARA